MKDLENKLLSMEMPKIENNQFEQILRNKLVRKYHSRESKYIRKFRYSIAFASGLFVFILSLFIFPEIRSKVNEVAFNKGVATQETNNANYSDDEFFTKFAEDNSKFYYTSIHNPNLKDKIDPEKYKEDKTYIIRKYVSKDSKAVMIISEFNRPEIKKQLREVSF
ncbi:MAG: hypothetical protein P9M11_00485 [Candidatus Tenebribacter burtonii]|jgi:hypothetical protein|nr:hypothetical protein [Candidatus Tenebribacter burtonii]